jgi:hypothetical protein
MSCAQPLVQQEAKGFSSILLNIFYGVENLYIIQLFQISSNNNLIKINQLNTFCALL